jgi:fructokinase
MRAVRAPGDAWPGVCRFHGDCIEGLASGPAIAARAGMPAGSVPDASTVWDLAAHSLGQLAHTLVLATGPRRILIGGGVMQERQDLLIRVRRKLLESLNGYVALEEVEGGIDGYVAPPGLGPLAGPLGALALAADAYAAAQGGLAVQG